MKNSFLKFFFCLALILSVQWISAQVDPGWKPPTNLSGQIITSQIPVLPAFYAQKELKIDANAKLSVDTLSDSDLLRVGSSFLSEQSKIRIDLIPTIAGLNEELKAVNHTIDSLSKMK